MIGDTIDKKIGMLQLSSIKLQTASLVSNTIEPTQILIDNSTSGSKYCQMTNDGIFMEETAVSASGGIGLLTNPFGSIGAKCLGLVSTGFVNCNNNNLFGVLKLTTLTTLANLITTPNASIGLDGKSLTNISALNSLTLTATTSVSSPLWTTANANHNFNTKGMTGITDITANTLTLKYTGATQYKVPMVLLCSRSAVASIPGTIAFFTEALDANLMGATGDRLTIKASGFTLNNANAKSVSVSVNGTSFSVNLQTGTSGLWILEAEAVRSTATQCDFAGKVAHSTLSNTFGNTGAAVTTFASAGSVVVSITGVGVNDVVGTAASIVYYPNQ